MNKKIIMAAVLMLAVTVLFAACKKDDEYQVSHTIEVGTTTVEVFTDKDGTEYVTNVDGDMIPMTSDKDGFYDNVEDLLTETTTQKSNDKTTTTKPSSTTTTTTTTTTTAPSTPSTPSDNDSTTSTTQQGVIVNGGKEDSVSWDEIVNAGKNQ